MKIRHLLFAFLVVPFLVGGQPVRNPNATARQPGKTIVIISADRYNFQDLGSGRKTVSLGGNAVVQQEKTIFAADSIVLDQQLNTLDATGNIHINDADSVQVYSQHLLYQGKEKKAFLDKQVKLTDGKSILTTDKLEYDVGLKLGTYKEGGKVVSAKTVLTSQEGYYYGDTHETYFEKKVVMTDSDFKLFTDTLLYNTESKIARFVARTKIQSGKKTIQTTEGSFDTKHKKGDFLKRTQIDDSGYTFSSDKAFIDDATGFSRYEGNAVYKSKDSLKGYDLTAGYIEAHQLRGSLWAARSPLLVIRQNGSNIYVAADTFNMGRVSVLTKSRTLPNLRDEAAEEPRTKQRPDTVRKDGPGQNFTNESLAKTSSTRPDSLGAAEQRAIEKEAASPQATKKTKSGKTTGRQKETLAKPSDNDRFVEAFRNVKIYHDSAQAVCDSLFYALTDSVFRMFGAPIVWSNNEQLTGDTMYLFLANQQPQRLKVYENAMAIEKNGPAYFNQVKGNSINAYFKKGNIDWLRAKGNAETIYYGVDENKKFIGVNRATCDMLEMYFNPKGSAPVKVVMKNNLQGTALPMGQADHESLRLRKFKWHILERPKSKDDLMKNNDATPRPSQPSIVN